MATMDVERVFLDTNVLVYANVLSSPFHDAALSRLTMFRAEGTELWISRQVLREFLAVRSRAALFPEPTPLHSLLERVRQFQDTFHVAEDGPAVTERLIGVLEKIPSSGRQIHDANIVATMLVHDVPNLLTHNVVDFRRYDDLINVFSLVT